MPFMQYNIKLELTTAKKISKTALIKHCDFEIQHFVYFLVNIMGLF